ncbi:MAG: hypothetical protein FJ290_11210 [Planctomycetes bacterium]|nr:hypothetical protein [Planctomycetota bacterium]
MTRQPSRGLLVATAVTLWLGAADGGEAALEFDGAPSVSGLKCTDKGPPTEPTQLLGYLDHFALKVKLKPGRGAGGLSMAAWLGRLAEGQLDAKFEKPDERGKPYQIEDAAGTLVPPQQPENQTAIAFHPEASNKTRDRANLSKGIGGRPVPLVPAKAGTTTLYSSMHQRFSYSLVAVVAEHAAKYGARYSLDQLGKLPRDVYRLRLPYAVALIDGEKRVVAVVHGDTTLKLDLTAANREATLQSFKGSGAPLVPFE